MASGLPVVAPALPRLRAILGGPGEARRACSTTAPTPGALAAALDTLADADRRRRAGRRRRAPAPSSTSAGRRTAATLDAAIAAMRATTARARRDDDGRIAVTCCSSPTPSRPSRGGSGWSTYELARGLRARGDRVTVLRPRPGTPAGLRVVAGRLRRLRRPRARRPVAADPVRPQLRQERAARARGSRRSSAISSASGRIDVVHGQHLLSIPGAIAGAHAAGVPVGRHHPRLLAGLLLVGSDPRSIERDALPGVLGGDDDALRARRTPAPAWPAALPAIPYMRANLRWKAGRLAEADAIVAVSAVMARDLVARAPALAGRRVEVIPNPVDVATLDAAARPPRPRRSPTSPARTRSTSASSRLNKGVQHLVPAAVAAQACTWPLVVVGDGPDRAALERRGPRRRPRRPLHRLARSRRDAGARSRTRRCSSSRRTAPSR